MSELLATLDGPAYIARVAVYNPKQVVQAKTAIKRAFLNQVQGKGFSLVEVLSACPTNWHQGPIESLEWIEKKMLTTFPLGTFKSTEGGGV